MRGGAVRAARTVTFADMDVIILRRRGGADVHAAGLIDDRPRTLGPGRRRLPVRREHSSYPRRLVSVRVPWVRGRRNTR
jgi:hypothetical protein